MPEPVPNLGSAYNRAMSKMQSLDAERGLNSHRTGTITESYLILRLFFLISINTLQLGFLGSYQKNIFKDFIIIN